MASPAIASSLPSLSGYTFTEQLYSGERTAVYRAIKTTKAAPDAPADAPADAEQSVIIKVLQQEYPSFSSLVQFRNQYSITQGLSIPGIIRPLSLEPWQNGYALVVEDFGGTSLHQYANTHTTEGAKTEEAKTTDQPKTEGAKTEAQAAQALPIGECLSIAQQLAGILNHLGQHNIVHKDIKPANILIHPESKGIELIDFSIASLLPKETQTIQNPNGLEGTLAYLAPEQTGRMNRGIDYRTDFYSLGVTLYELLTGERPFQANDPLELVHCHIAKTPTAPHQINPAIPPVLSAIVLKLMAKNAENRYQSARGLQHDLTRCLEQWHETGKILFFELGERDLSDRFVVSEKLYGRNTEVRALLGAFERIAASKGRRLADGSPAGNTEMMLVAGFSGIGKTAIINEIHKPITRQQGYFIKGKFDQLNRNVPLSAFLQALQDLIGQILSESDTKLAHWRKQILAVLGENAQVLIEVIPELEAVIGPQPSAPALSGSAGQTRFNRLLQQFMGVFTSPKHPLVIFVDDLQWADSASLQVITKLMAEQSHLLLLGAYRDNEVSPAHPLILTVEGIKQTQAKITTLTLLPLSLKDTNQLIADTLHCSTERAKPLTEAILRKTEGNPFFTTQFLKSLYEEGLISFNQRDRYWEADITQINTLSFTDDVVEFMAQQLEKLPPSTQQVFQLAACIGNRFDLETLAIAADKSCAQTAEALWEGLREGLIVPQSEIYKFYLGDQPLNQTNGDQSNGNQSSTQTEGANTNEVNTENITYKFLHDRVQQAAYTLISEDKKQTFHLKIGQRLLEHSCETSREENLFEIVNHLNIGVELIATPLERSNLSQLNLRAGQKAKASTAYPAAIEYFTTGIGLLKPDCWQSQYILALALHESIAEASLMCGELEQMEQWAQVVLEQATALSDRTTVYEVKIQAQASRNQFLDAIKIGIEALQQFGIDLPAEPNPGHIQQAFGETIALLNSHGFDSQANNGENISALADLPLMVDADKLSIIRLTSTMVPAAFLGLPALFPLLVLIQIKTSVEHGNSPQAAYSYASYGLLLNLILNDIKAAERFGKLALELTFNLPSKTVKSKAYFVVAAFIKHHTSHLQDALTLMLQSYQMALESGNLEYVGYALFHICHDAYLLGNELGLLKQNIRAYSQVLANHQQLATLNYCNLCQQAVLNLLGESKAPTSLSSENSSSKNSAAKNSTSKNSTAENSASKNSAAENITAEQAPAPYQLIGEAFNEETALPQMLAIHDVTGLYKLYTHKLILSYLFEEIAQANENAAQARQYMAGGAGFAITPVFYFYEALAILRQLPEASPDSTSDSLETRTDQVSASRSHALEQVTDTLEKLTHWAEHAPMNYGHKVELIKAERCRTEGEMAAALEHYEQAIAQSKEHGYLQESALANELAAKFYLSWGKEKVAAGYLQEAYYGYARWGAKAKVKQLENHYPQLLLTLTQTNTFAINEYTTLTPSTLGTLNTISRITRSTGSKITSRTHHPTSTINNLTGNATSTRATTSKNIWLDFSAIMKAAQAISQEIELDKLLATLMNIVLANAGAQLGHFILRQNDEWVVTAEANEQQVKAVEILVETSLKLPTSLIYAVARSQKAAVFENLSLSGQFESDRYIGAYQPKSALCMPISRQGQVAGILYLENNLIEGAFTEDRIETLQILTSQAAISIENARLYQQTERYSQSLEIEVSKKTEDLNQKVKDLEKTLTQLKETQAQLIQTEKMSSLGQLVAGVAHEINNPINFIHSNIRHLGNYNQDLLDLVHAYADAQPAPPESVKALLEDIDLDFLAEDSQQLVKSVNNGSDRIKQIVLSLRNFSRLDESEIKRVNIHEGIESTLVILRHRLKATPTRPEILVVRNFSELPKVECLPGKLNQALMNILTNAIDALSERAAPTLGRSALDILSESAQTPKTIEVSTKLTDDNNIAIHISDNGIGISEEMRSRIFDPFFTTKPIGEGPGLGLTVSYQIITETHKGKLSCQSTLGKGTEMIIEIPQSVTASHQ